MRYLSRWGLATIVFLSVAGLALADDANPPSWRGDEFSTVQSWEFGTDANVDANADAYTNSNGMPMADITGTWASTWEGKTGVWLLSGLIDATIPNTPVHMGMPKTIWVQLTWAPESEGAVPAVTVLANAYNPEVIGSLVETEVEGSWNLSTYQLIEPNNPDWETIRISGCIGVEEMVIDTIPEPATAMLLGLGAVALIRRRRAD
jgi:hypothetical protein